MADDQREGEGKRAAHGPVNQSFAGPTFSQTGNDNKQYVSIDRALIQAAPLDYDPALSLLRRAIRDFINQLPRLNKIRHSLDEDAAMAYMRAVIPLST